MATIKFISLDKKTRMASFDVDGKTIARQISDNFDEHGQTIDDQVMALADGLAIEFADQDAPTEINDTSIAAGTILVSDE